MTPRRIALPCALAALLVPAAAAVAQTPTPTPAPVPAPAPVPVPAPAPAPAPAVKTIAAGTTVGGLAVGGLTLEQATAKLQGSALAKKLARDTKLDVAGETYRMKASQADLGLDAERSAKRALYAKTPGAAIVPAVTFRRSGTRAFVASVAAKARRAAVNSTGRIGLRSISITRSKPGYRLDELAARKVIDAALADPSGTRALKQAVTPVPATTNANDVRRRYSTVVTVEKATFTLRLFKDLKVVKRYSVAVGQPAYPTPSGQWTIANKQVDPTWSVPNSPWAGELQGTTVDGGSAANPLKARWMGIVNGIGIHGTGEDGSIGSRASHGCIRMHVADVKALYDRVPVGTPVRIG